MFKSLLLKGRTLCLLLCCMVSSLVVTAQTKQTGKVIGSDDKLPIVGASIRIKGTNTGAVTDIDGNFTLSLSPGNVLVVSYIGFQTKEVPFKTGPLTIELEPSNKTLNEVVVTGYQTQVKKDITGAVGMVDITDAKKIPATSSEQLLQGQVSGVTVINQGAPGSGSTVFVRGVSNFGNTTPLYVIDGVQSNNMSQVNPTDIESISVLKDAGAAAIYGVAGGNGVIVITTKKGKPGKTVISYDGYVGQQRPLGGNVWHLMNPSQQSTLTFEAGDKGGETLYPGGAGTLPTYGYHGTTAYGNFGTAGVTNDPGIVGGYLFDPVTPNNDFLVQKFDQAGNDWFHDIFKNALQQSHTVTASGGTDHSTFLYSLQYLDQQGTLIETFEKRYQLRVNNTYSLFNNHFRFGENGYVYYRENNGGSPYNQQQEGGSISETYREMPIIPTYDVSGVNYGGGYDGPSGEPLGNGSNPVAVQERSANNLNRTWNMQGTVFAELDFAKYFTARTSFSGNAQNNFYYFAGYNTYENYESHTSPNSYDEASNYQFSYNYTNTLSYKETFGKHVISAFAGYEIKQTGGQQVGGYATNFISLDPAYVSLAQTTNPASISLTGGNGTFLYQPTGTESYFGRVDYSYADKYLFGATIRRDGYSEFYPGRQWGSFPSVSLGWRISQEDFLKSASWLQELKLRGSYGESGNNSNIGGANALNTYYSSFAATDYAATGSLNTLTTGVAQNSIGNPKTTWETDKILNIGVDVSVFNHLDFTAEYYRKQSSNLLFQQQLPSTAGGATAPYVNIGQVNNNGVDFSATYHDQIGSDFRFSITTNISAYKSDIAAINQTQYLFGGSRLGAFVELKKGEPMGEFYGYKINGINQNTAQLNSTPNLSGSIVGSYIYNDTDHNGIVDANDETAIGNPNPDFTYGLNLNASYKHFDFSMVLYGSQGNKDFNYVKWWTDTYNSFPGGKQLNLLTNSATVVNGQVTNPGATQEALAVATTPASTFYIENGSFLKCRVAQIGYTFDPGFLKTIGASKLHVYVQGTNLFTITKYTGPDPELVPSIQNNGSTNTASASYGVDWGAYPTNQRTYIIGVNVSF
ncbi:SusC/RagA family TonB-linked outer membrane protein [Mucilaginibacter sp. X4EP1]|uniref:SusC/RagA family TonB-linked outer membrane protein n=1 Tax=Mucilaginibacter sp. X4EP1 TaxID=2723092 RepID=UPI00216A9C84|nr:TonB-dependent receptor [Mucilaginibacter sp. X4EP1]MCS3812434.1 TonB-linked SusC/RagA family outer membrane protein [Mucilaginibacter sp. X4EP1]